MFFIIFSIIQIFELLFRPYQCIIALQIKHNVAKIGVRIGSNFMKEIMDQRLIEQYYQGNHMNHIFSKDMKPFMKLFKIERNEYLCVEEEEMFYLYFLVRGRAKACKSLENGRTALLCFYSPFQALGDLELMNNKTANTTVEAIRDCYTLAIPMKVARSELKEDTKFLMYTCQSLADKLTVTSINCTINMLYPLENRLASYIKMMTDTEQGERLYFNDNLTHLAELLGTSYRHLLRTIKGFVEKEIIRKEKKGYLVVNEELLNDYAGDLYENLHQV